MEQVSNICAFLCGLCAIVAPIALVVWIIAIIKKSERRKKAKRFFLGTLAGVVLFTAIGVATSGSGTDDSIPSPTIQCEHKWEETRKEATCESDGVITYKCKECDYEETESIAATGHTFSEEIIVEEASCTSEGVLERSCSVCNEVESTIIEKTSHTYEVTSNKEATLEAPGVEESTCSVCGDIKRKEFAKLGTKENPGKVTVEELVSEINSNKDVAKAKYNEQWVEITGKVLDASNVAGMARFYLYGKSGDSGLRIVCWVNEEVLKPFDYDGEVHTFLGQVREITTVNATEIGDCQIISD